MLQRNVKTAGTARWNVIGREHLETESWSNTVGTDFSPVINSFIYYANISNEEQIVPFVQTDSLLNATVNCWEPRLLACTHGLKATPASSASHSRQTRRTVLSRILVACRTSWEWTYLVWKDPGRRVTIYFQDDDGRGENQRKLKGFFAKLWNKNPKMSLNRKKRYMNKLNFNMSAPQYQQNTWSNAQ